MGIEELGLGLAVELNAQELEARLTKLETRVGKDCAQSDHGHRRRTHCEEEVRSTDK